MRYFSPPLVLGWDGIMTSARLCHGLKTLALGSGEFIEEVRDTRTWPANCLANDDARPVGVNTVEFHALDRAHWAVAARRVREGEAHLNELARARVERSRRASKRKREAARARRERHLKRFGRCEATTTSGGRCGNPCLSRSRSVCGTHMAHEERERWRAEKRRRRQELQEPRGPVTPTRPRERPKARPKVRTVGRGRPTPEKGLDPGETKRLGDYLRDWNSRLDRLAEGPPETVREEAQRKVEADARERRRQAASYDFDWWGNRLRSLAMRRADE